LAEGKWDDAACAEVFEAGEELVAGALEWGVSVLLSYALKICEEKGKGMKGRGLFWP